MYQQEIQHQCCAGITAADAARWSEDDDHIEEMYRTGQTSIYTGPQPQATPQQEQQLVPLGAINLDITQPFLATVAVAVMLTIIAVARA